MIPALLAAALAAPFGALPVQGQLTDAAGAPIDGALDVTFTLYVDTSRSDALWTRTLAALPIARGAFSARLEDVDLAWFRDHPSMVLGVRVGADPEMDPIPLGHVPYAGWAAYAGDAATVGGRSAESFKDVDWTPSWSDVRDVPADLADGDDIGAAGDGLRLDEGTFSLDPEAVTGLCYDSVDELRAALDDAYLAAGWRPSWADLDGVPADLLDGDDVAIYEAGTGLTLNDTTFALDPDAVTALCFDTEAELRAALDDAYLAAGWRPSWADLDGVPADLLDGDDVGVYRAGPGIVLSGDTFLLDVAAVQDEAAGVCFDTEDELHAALDDDYLPIGYAPAWREILGVPADLADGDQDTRYTAGGGLTLVGTTFSLDNSAVRAQCFDTEAELTAALNDNYLPASYTPTWASLTGVPADLADGDQDTRYTAGSGLTLTGTSFSLDNSAVRAQCFDTEAELTAALDDNYLAASYRPPWGQITGMPADIADGDQNTTYTAGAGMRLTGTTSLDSPAVRANSS